MNPRFKFLIKRPKWSAKIWLFSLNVHPSLLFLSFFFKPVLFGSIGMQYEVIRSLLMPQLCSTKEESYIYVLVSDFCPLTCSKSSAQATRPNASWYQTSRPNATPGTSISSCWQGQTATSVIANSVSADIRPANTYQLLITPCCHSLTAAELRPQMLKWQWSLWLNSEHVWEKCVTSLGFTNLIMISNWLNSSWPEHVVCPGDMMIYYYCGDVTKKKNPTMCFL